MFLTWRKRDNISGEENEHEWLCYDLKQPNSDFFLLYILKLCKNLFKNQSTLKYWKTTALNYLTKKRLTLEIICMF